MLRDREHRPHQHYQCPTTAGLLDQRSDENVGTTTRKKYKGINTVVLLGHAIPRSLKLIVLIGLLTGITLILGGVTTITIVKKVRLYRQERRVQEALNVRSRPVLSAPPAHATADKSGSLSYKSYVECVNNPNCTNSETKKEIYYPHDNPDHVWHWSRAHGPSPILSKKRDCKGDMYLDLYHNFHKKGYAVFESCSLKNHPEKLIDQVRDFTKANLHVPRVDSAKVRPVREMAVDPDTLEFIEYLHGGKRAFPFQTLNFAVGTQQGFHSDLIHFDTKPRTLMSAAWVALEDMNENNGPLKYIPESHHFGVWDYDEMGLRHKTEYPQKLHAQDNYTLYISELERMTKAAGLKVEIAKDMKKGQTLIWAAGLVHGGSNRKDQSLTRLSQVTHYWFEGADYYWVPRYSDLSRGQVFYREETFRCTAPDYAPKQIFSCADHNIQRWLDAVNDEPGLNANTKPIAY